MIVEYQTIFDARDNLAQVARPAMLGLAFVTAGLVMTWLGSKRPMRLPLLTSGLSIATFAAVWTAIALLGPVSRGRALAAALRSGRYEVVEGTVRDYASMPRNRTGGYEAFAVGTHEYRLSNYDGRTAGFNRTRLDGSSIREGVRVRIADVGGVIARLEIAPDRDRRPTEVRQQQPAQQRDSVDPATARSVMAVADSFLQQYVETTAKRYSGPVRYWTGDCALAEVSPSLWVGDYQILSVGRRNDTLVVAAALTSVAEEGESRVVANRFVVRPRITTDTLHWRVVRDTSGDLLVCGFALENVDLGGFGRPDNVDFEGGTSPRRLRQQADSLRGARRAPTTR